MAGAEFQAAIREGQIQALALEPRLIRQYERVIGRAGKRAASAYVEKASIRAAAGDDHPQPSIDEVLHAEAVAASSSSTTRATRRRMARMIGAVIEGGQLQRRLLPMLEELVESQAGIQAERLVEGSRDAIRRVILQSQAEGLSVPNTAKLILEEMRSIAPWQARMLARTDLIAISNGSSLASASVLPEQERPQFKTWITAGDHRVRPEHVAANKQTVPTMQPFNVGGTSMMFPGDPSGGSALTINCRCSIIYGDEAQPSLANSAGLDPFEALTAAGDGILPNVPFAIREREGKQCVVKTTTGEVVKCHDDRAQARRHLAALILNVEDAMSASIAEFLEVELEHPQLSEDETGDAVLAASPVAPLHPPAEWFDDPQLKEPTPITVTEDGRVFGHVALWDQCHTGIQGRCVLAPRGITYDFFNTGVIDAENESPIRVGKITAATGHAPLTAAREAATAHYDDTGTVVAYVQVGEDEFGPYMAGALKSDATPEQIRDLRANSVSGDWRAVRRSDGTKQLELVGVLSVPVPGFPIQRAIAAAGAEEEVTALIAGFSEEAIEGPLSEQEFDQKLRVLGARAIGAEELLSLAKEPLTEQAKRFRSMRAAPAQSVAVEPEPQDVNITISLGDLVGKDLRPMLSMSPKVQREVGLQVDYMRDHGHWQDQPISGEKFTSEEWDQVMSAAPDLVKEPDTSQSLNLLERLRKQGYLPGG